MTITSDAGGTLQGVAANASAVTYTIFGDEVTPGAGALSLGIQNEYGYLTTAGCGVIATRIGLQGVSATGLSGSLILMYFKAPKTFTSSSWKMANGTAAGATPTLIRGGLYTVDLSGNLTLVASSANDTTLLNGTNVAYTKSFSTPYGLTQGLQYAFGFLFISAATAPTILMPALANAVTHFAYDTAPRVSGVVSSQSDLPSSVSAGSVSSLNVIMWAELS